MMSQSIRLLSAFSMATGTVLLAASCSLPVQRQIEQAGRARADQSHPSRKIAQLHFGRDASFAVCVEAACPAVTRKTLMIKPQAPANAIPPSVDMAATLDPGEVELKVQRTSVRSAVAPVPPIEHLRAPVIVTFASGSAALSSAARAVLDQAVSGARAAERIVIAGRTDNVGSKSANQTLALARARAVRDYLRSRLPSYPSHAFTLDAQGTCCFTASNDTPEGRRQNRRVEVVFSVPGQVTP